MSENNGWPGKPGVPMNPERDGWHWIFLLGGKDNAQVIEWLGPEIGWDETDWTTEDFGLHARYLGPCLTPAEVDARVKEAQLNALEELERHFKEAAAGTPLGHEDRQRGASTYNWLMYCVSTIRALKGEGDE